MKFRAINVKKMPSITYCHKESKFYSKIVKSYKEAKGSTSSTIDMLERELVRG